LVEDSANPDTSPFVIDGDGNIAIGSLSPSFNYSFGPIKLVAEGTGSDSFLGVNRYAAAPSGPGLVFGKSRGATVGSRASVASGDNLGEISWRGDDGTNWLPAASVTAFVDGTPGTNDMPGRLVFSTTPDGTGSLVERARLDNEGKMGLGATPAAGQSFVVGRHMIGSVSSVGILSSGVVQSTVTTSARAFDATFSTTAAAFSLGTATHFHASGVTIGSGSSITNQYGFFASSGITTATNNFGFYSDIASTANRWNFYANGTAANYFAGNVSIGTTNSGFTYGFGPVKVIVEGTGSDSFAGLNRYSASTSAPGFVLGKSRGATVGTRAAVIAGDSLGEISWRADDGTNWVSAASIVATVDGTPGTNDMPGRLSFFTTLDGTSSLVERARIDNEGKIGFGATPAAGQSFVAGRNITGSVSSVGILSSGVVQSGVTTSARAFDASFSTVAAGFTLTTATHFHAQGITLGSGSAITNQYGFFAGSAITAATNNFGFYSDIASAANRWNFYANGTAPNYFAGNVSIGTTTSTSALSVNGFITENSGDGIYWNVVSQRDIGFAPNQIPLNQFLGQMAFIDQHYPAYSASSSTADAAISVDASVTERYSHIASFTADRTIQVSNLVPKKDIVMYVRNTNASARIITIQASVTTSGFANVNLAPGPGSGAASVSTVTLAANSGTVVIWISNIDGNIVGGLLS